jgi:predicted lipoprotein with Yx(FWY)xxD motif
VLVDAQGHTLYLYQKDVAGKSSSCAAACATAWPPVTGSAAPTAGTGVTAAKLGTITRADGSKQITYYGWPLYRHATDVKAGDVTGEKVDAAWFAVSPVGTAVGG